LRISALTDFQCALTFDNTVEPVVTTTEPVTTQPVTTQIPVTTEAPTTTQSE